MAKLSAHGTELLRYERHSAYSDGQPYRVQLSVRSDGYILRNHDGRGWKLAAHLKDKGADAGTIKRVAHKYATKRGYTVARGFVNFA